MFDEEGNAYLADFGIVPGLAGAAQPADATVRTDPAATRDEASPSADLYGLANVTHEMLAGLPRAGAAASEPTNGHHTGPVPRLHPRRPDIPPAVDEAIARATLPRGGDGYPDVAAFTAALSAAVGGLRETPAVPAAARNPYKGLRAFGEADAVDFFGCERRVEQLVARLAAGRRFVAVVGPSGSGKSSLVRAGLMPRLRDGGVAGSERWFVADLVPGSDPAAAYRTALSRVAARPLAANLASALEHDPHALMRAAAWVLPDGAELLLVVDQLEELFTLGEDRARRDVFLDGIVAAVTAAESQVRVVATIRADFYDRPLRHAGLAALLRDGTEPLPPLSAAELERAVVGPAEQVGVAVESALVTQVVADVVDQPAALPLLQYALTELFEQRHGATLSAATYAAVGGVAGALARRAEAIYEQLSDAGREAARQLFLRLVEVGASTGDTRRRAARAELLSLEPEPGAMETAIGTFGLARLLTFDRDPETRGPTVEVAHEALLEAWPRLCAWIDDARAELGHERRLAAAAREWAAADRDRSFLASGARLDQFTALAQGGNVGLTPEQRGFLDASVAERDRRDKAERSRLERERALERRSLRRLRALVAVFAAAALLAGGLTLAAAHQARQRAEQARIATARELAAAAVANLDVDPERSILLALEAVDTTRTADGIVLPQAEEALRRAVRSSRLLASVPRGYRGLAVTADGAQFATTGRDGSVTLWTVDGDEVLAFDAHGGAANGVAFAPDGRVLATTGDDGTVRLWDAGDGAALGVLQGHDGVVTSPAFSPDGTLVAAGSGDGSVRVWDVAAGRQMLHLTGHEWPVFTVAFSPDGRQLATASEDHTARIWDLDSGTVVATVASHIWPVMGVAFSPDGLELATAALDATARVSDPDSGEQRRVMFHPAPVMSVAYSPDGTRIATGGSDGRTRIWEADSGRQLMTLPGHTADVTAVAFTAHGDRLLTTSVDGTTRVWDVSVGGARDWRTVAGARDIVTTLAFSPDGAWFAAPDEPSGLTVWETASGMPVRTLDGVDVKLSTVTVSPDGRLVAAASDLTRSPAVWDATTGELRHTLDGHTDDAPRGIAFSPDSRRLATGGWDGTVRLWDALDGRQLEVVEPHRGPVVAVGFDPDGRALVAGSGDGSVTVWQAETLTEERVLLGHAETVAGLAFGPGGLLATASWDGTAKLWDLATGRELATLRGHDAPVHHVAVSPNGTQVATASDDATAKLWDVETGRELMTFYGHDLIVTGVAFSPDGRLLGTASADGTVALHLLPTDEFVEHARGRVTRTLTPEECRQHLVAERCPVEPQTAR